MSVVPWITSFTGGALRNDFTGCVGLQFTVGGANVTVSALGRYMFTGNSGIHTVAITDTAGIYIVSGSVNLSGGTPGTWIYTTVANTILNAGITYCLISSETIGGDQWQDDTSLILTTLPELAIVASVFQANCTGGITTNAANRSYVPPNLKYDTSSIASIETVQMVIIT